MMHDKRRFSVATLASVEELVTKLTEYSWCSCVGFRLGDWLFLNDQTGPDGAGEWAIVREKDMVQVESITFGWCSKEKTLQYVREILDGKYATVYSKVANRIESPKEHGTCGACA